MTEKFILPEEGYIRISDVIKVIPLGKSTIYAKIAKGEFPPPIKISSRVSAWPVDVIRQVIADFNSNAGGA